MPRTPINLSSGGMKRDILARLPIRVIPDGFPYRLAVSDSLMAIDRRASALDIGSWVIN
jgi:hypothetical protein